MYYAKQILQYTNITLDITFSKHRLHQADPEV